MNRLHPELLVCIFRLAQREDDARHREAYGVRAPARMPLVCRWLRDTYASFSTGHEERTLCVPLLHPDGTTPTFVSAAAWRAYFAEACVGTRMGANLCLVSSPAGPLDIPAHLAAIGFGDKKEAPAEEQDLFAAGDGGAYETDALDMPHVRHVPAAWSFWLCGRVLRELGLTHLVTRVEMRMCLPLSIGARERSCGPGAHVEMWQLPCMLLGERCMPRLRVVSFRVGITPITPPSSTDEDIDCSLAQNDLATQAWQPFAHGLCLRTTPIDELRVGLEDTADPRWRDVASPFDDFVLKLLVHACNARTGGMLYMIKTRDGGAWWISALCGGLQGVALADYPLKARRVRLLDHGQWADRTLLETLALLCTEEVCLEGTRVFRPDVESSLDPADFWGAASRRQAPTLTLRWRGPPIEDPPAWLRVAPLF